MSENNIFTNVDDICNYLGLSTEETVTLAQVAEKYPMAVPDYYLSLIDPSDPKDPIRKMCIPDEGELDVSGERDTSGESDNTVALGLQHKYPQTVLILSTNHCAMYCRHCFRKRMVGATEDEINKNFQDTVRYIKNHPEVNNVLITGGDALMLSHEMLERYLDAFTSMEQLDFIRVGSRIPVVFPQRVLEDESLQTLFRKYAAKKQIFLITQFNHPHEITEEASACVRVFREMGIVVRNQTVLLRGVNDDPYVLGTLLQKLTSIGILPYYVFQCRPVRGVKTRFQVPLARGVQIVEAAKSIKGKVEILGQLADGRMLFKFHQSKDPMDYGRIFSIALEEDQCWINVD
ncbi:MAG: KamA family radical SAM protein [Peptococcaceae bacterium]|nr:KamA family radical SAM protein [Peptococcaceae bacterium]